MSATTALIKKSTIYNLKNIFQNLLRKPLTIYCYFRADFNGNCIFKTSDNKYHYSFIKFIFTWTNTLSTMKLCSFLKVQFIYLLMSSILRNFSLQQQQKLWVSKTVVEKLEYLALFLELAIINPSQSFDSRWFGHHGHVTFHFGSCR